MSDIKRIGYGQVQLNHVSAQKTGQIYAQLPVDSTITLVEQGMFLKYDYAHSKCGLTGDGEWMLVYSEEKLYDERKQHHRDFALKAEDFTDGKIYPRLFKTNIGDLFTTNTFGAYDATYRNTTAGIQGIPVGATGGNAGETLAVGNYVTVDTTTGYLTKANTAVPSAAGVPVFQVVKDYQMPDMQPGVKLQRIA